MALGSRNEDLANRPPAWVTLGFVLLMVLLISSTVTSSVNAQRVLENNQWVRHTLVVREHLSGVLAEIVDSESVNRNFLLTGEETYLRDFEQRCSEVELGMTELLNLISDNPLQIRNFGRLRGLVRDKAAFMSNLIAIRQTEGQAVSAEGVRTGVGLRLMQDIKSVIGGMNAEEQRLLVIRTSETDTSIRRVEGSFFVGTALGIVMLTAYFLSLRRFVAQQARAKREVEVALEARVRAEVAEQRVLAELWRSNRELQDFAFVASHDLQEPLRKILAFGDRLKIKSEGRLSEDGQDYLERMLNAASRMQKLIDDLLVFSRVTTKARPFTEVDLNLVLADVQETLEHRIESLGARVTIERLPKIEADFLQMHQLFQNLLGNALKFPKFGSRHGWRMKWLWSPWAITALALIRNLPKRYSRSFNGSTAGANMKDQGLDWRFVERSSSDIAERSRADRRQVLGRNS